MTIRYKVPPDIRRGAVFDPECVILGTDVIDWGSFGYGNTVIIDPTKIGVTTKTVQTAAYRFATMIRGDVSTRELDDEGRDLNKRRLAVCFVRKGMADLIQNQGEWLGAVERT